MIAGVTRYALISGIALGVLGVFLPRQGLASLMPGARYCGPYDTQQTIDAEKAELSRDLPGGYRRFEIPLFHERLLHVFVPGSSLSLESPKVHQIVEIWGDILEAHHKRCAVSGYLVFFYSNAGKLLFGTGVEI